MQQTSNGRRILWLAHEGAPKNFSGVDVTDPRNPKLIVQTDLPHMKLRSNSLDVVGDIMAVAYQASAVGIKPAGFDLFDVSTPEKPRLISHFDCSGPNSRGVHALWFVDGKYVHMAAGSPDSRPRNPRDDQFYRIVAFIMLGILTLVGSFAYLKYRDNFTLEPANKDGDSL